MCHDVTQSFWREVDAWDRYHSNDYDLWSSDPDPVRALNEAAIAFGKTDSEAAFPLYLEAAEAGSVWAMETVACYHERTGPIEDRFERAQEYYRRAIDAGSWMAAINYADLLKAEGHLDQCDQVLEDGVRAGFVPAYFRLAWYRYRRSPKRATAREIRPLLDHAAAEGHPGAERMLAVFMARGRFGLREIPRGFRRVWKGCWKPDEANTGDDGKATLQLATQ